MLHVGQIYLFGAISSQTHRIHGTGIFTYMKTTNINQLYSNVGINIPYINPMRKGKYIYIVSQTTILAGFLFAVFFGGIGIPWPCPNLPFRLPVRKRLTAASFCIICISFTVLGVFFQDFTASLLGCPRKIGSMVSNWVISPQYTPFISSL